MEKEILSNNKSFNYLRDYYNALDIAKIFGISDMEIKHSNFLKWVLQPVENDQVSNIPIKQLLKTLQTNINSPKLLEEYNEFKNIDIESAKITDVDVVREKYAIDFVITLNLNDEKYVITIENKIEAPERENQLSDYRNIIDSKYSNSKRLFVLLHPSFKQLATIDKNELLKNSAITNNYISLTYQDIYDSILKEYLKATNDSQKKFILNAYIHTLSCYYSFNICGLIVEDNEKENLEALFTDDEFISIISDIRANIEFYRENKEIVSMLCEKYKLLKDYSLSDELTDIIRKLEKFRCYKFEGKEYKTSYEFTYAILEDIVKNEHITCEEDFGENLQKRLFGNDWFLHKYYKGIENVYGGIMNFRTYPPLIIDGSTYYSAQYVSYFALLELYELIIERFPEYKDKIDIL